MNWGSAALIATTVLRGARYESRERATRFAAIAIYLAAAVLVVGVIFQSILLFDVLPNMQAVLSSGVGEQFLMAKIAKAVLTILMALIIVSFAWASVRKQTIFMRGQSVKLALAGAVTLIDFFISALAPRYSPPAGVLFKMDPSVPIVDYQALSFAIVLFALAAVFEYARLLQEDSDDIL